MHTTFGVVLGIFVLTQASIVPESVYQKNQDASEQSDSDKDEVLQISESPAVPSSNLQINLDYQSYLVTEVIHQEEEKDKVQEEKLLLPAAQKALKVLFRRIISPNAP